MGEWLSYAPGIRLCVFDMALGHCFYCGQTLKGYWEVDHIEPRSKVGRDDSLTNLAPACRSCNSRKGAFRLEEFRTREERRLNCEKYVFYFEQRGIQLGASHG